MLAWMFNWMVLNYGVLAYLLISLLFWAESRKMAVLCGEVMSWQREVALECHIHYSDLTVLLASNLKRQHWSWNWAAAAFQARCAMIDWLDYRFRTWRQIKYKHGLLFLFWTLPLVWVIFRIRFSISGYLLLPPNAQRTILLVWGPDSSKFKELMTVGDFKINNDQKYYKISPILGSHRLSQ